MLIKLKLLNVTIFWGFDATAHDRIENCYAVSKNQFMERNLENMKKVGLEKWMQFIWIWNFLKFVDREKKVCDAIYWFPFCVV